MTTCGRVSLESFVHAMKLSMFWAKVVLLSAARCSAYARIDAPLPPASRVRCKACKRGGAETSLEIIFLDFLGLLEHISSLVLFSKNHEILFTSNHIKNFSPSILGYSGVVVVFSTCYQTFINGQSSLTVYDPPIFSRTLRLMTHPTFLRQDC